MTRMRLSPNLGSRSSHAVVGDVNQRLHCESQRGATVPRASRRWKPVPRRAWVIWGLTALVLTPAGCHRPVARHSAACPSGERGRILLLPGISNTSGELAGLSLLLEKEFPDRDVDVRPWGPPMLLFSNLSGYEENLRRARGLAEELTAYRLAHPDRTLDVLGYSGGGAMACFVVASLPERVRVDRLVLVAPAISRQYPLETAVLPKVRDFTVVFTSPYDPLVGAGTRVFGTMDRRNAASAGSLGFPIEDDKLVQVRWEPKMLTDGHFGGHLDYLSLAWQRKYLLPAFDHRSPLERLSGIPARSTPYDAGSAVGEVDQADAETAGGAVAVPESAMGLSRTGEDRMHSHRATPSRSAPAQSIHATPPR